MQHRIETRVEQDGVITVRNLPFNKGETVEVVITVLREQSSAESDYPLRGKPVRLINPFDAVAEDEWIK